MRKIGEYNDVRYKILNFSYMYPQRVKHFMILNGKLEKSDFYFIKINIRIKLRSDFRSLECSNARGCLERYLQRKIR